VRGLPARHTPEPASARVYRGDARVSIAGRPRVRPWRRCWRWCSVTLSRAESGVSVNHLHGFERFILQSESRPGGIRHRGLPDDLIRLEKEGREDRQAQCCRGLEVHDHCPEPYLRRSQTLANAPPLRVSSLPDTLMKVSCSVPTQFGKRLSSTRSVTMPFSSFT
jgi:hypothetical protein